MWFWQSVQTLSPKPLQGFRYREAERDAARRSSARPDATISSHYNVVGRTALTLTWQRSFFAPPNEVWLRAVARRRCRPRLSSFAACDPRHVPPGLDQPPAYATRSAVACLCLHVSIHIHSFTPVVAWVPAASGASPQRRWLTRTSPTTVGSAPSNAP